MLSVVNNNTIFFNINMKYEAVQFVEGGRGNKIRSGGNAALFMRF